MAPMRASIAALALCAAAAAEEPAKPDAFPPILAEFEAHRATAFDAGARSTIFPALEALTATRDVRAVGPIASVLADAIRADPRLQEAFRTVQKRGAAARDQLDSIGKELTLLEEREKAGATDVGPRIQRLEQERATLSRVFEQVQLEVGDLDRRKLYLDEFREKLSVACSQILGGLAAEQAERAILAVRGSLELSDPTESLHLVRILRDSKLPQASRHLVEIFEHPKAPVPARAAAASAAVALGDRDAWRAAVRLWRRDPEGAGPQVQVALSLVAKRPMVSPDDAEAWIREPAKAPGK